MMISMISGGFAVLCHHLAVPANGYISPGPSSSSSFPRSAFVGRQTSTLHRPIIRHGALFLSIAEADLYNSTEILDDSSLAGDVPFSPPAALGTSGDWSAFLDESKGLIYYFNQRTGESKWEPPEDADFSGVQIKIGAAKKVEMRERLKSYLEERLNDSATEFAGAMPKESKETELKREGANAKPKTKKPELESTKKVPSEDTRNKDFVSEWGQWQALIDNKRGQMYYFDKKTRQSRWDRPEGFPSFKLSASKRIALEEQNKRYLEWHKGATKVSVLGRGEVTVSDSNFYFEAKATDSNKVIPEPAPETKTNNLSANKDVVEEFNGVGAIMGEGPDAFSIDNQPPTLPIVQQGEWSAYFDIKSGLVFYFNEETGKTSWDPPFQDFPRIVMEENAPKVLDPGLGNISMERALGYIGMDEMSEALAWEEAKKKERARKAAMRAKKAKVNQEASTVEPEVEVVEMYEAAKKAELERISHERKIAEEQKAREDAATKLAKQEREQLEREQIKAEAAAKAAIQEKLEQERREKERLEQERIAAEDEAEKDRQAAAQQAIRDKLNQERLEKQRLEKEKLEGGKTRQVETEFKQPAAPKADPAFTVESVETMVAPLKTSTLYDILQCSSTASRIELKRSYLSLAKQTHPDALLQNGMVNNDSTERRFVEISQAWKILGDPTSRRRYDRELGAKGISSKAGNMFETWVVGAAKAMDEALAKAENGLERGGGKKP